MSGSSTRPGCPSEWPNCRCGPKHLSALLRHSRPADGQCAGSIEGVSNSAGAHGDSSGTGIVIAVDGPSASGKSSASRGTARALGLRYLDTGAMYRALTWWLLARGVPVDDEEAAAREAGVPVIEGGTAPDDPGGPGDGPDGSAATPPREEARAVPGRAPAPRRAAPLLPPPRARTARGG